MIAKGTCHFWHHLAMVLPSTSSRWIERKITIVLEHGQCEMSRDHTLGLTISNMSEMPKGRNRIKTMYTSVKGKY